VTPRRGPGTESDSRAALVIISALLASMAWRCATTQPGIEKALVVSTDGADSATVVAGPEYAAGSIHRLLFGDHYRDLWTTPVRTEVLDLCTLTPADAGGGFQTRSLRFRSADGRMFKFRSINKDPTAVLPLELRTTFAGYIAHDHTSTAHPAGALIVDSLAGAAGVPRVFPRVVLLPDHERLGDFRADFGGLLGVFEEYPDDGFGGFPKVQNTMKVFEQMEEDSRDRPDARAYLRARLLDILVGDWDRHVKQWRWGRKDNHGVSTWYPIPVDRDQAFVRLDGLFPSVASMAISQFESFSEEFTNITKLTFSGRFLDRRLLVSLDRQAWDSVAADFVGRLTDSVIEGAVRRLPSEYFTRDGDRIINALRHRRDTFFNASVEYYRLLADFVDIHLSGKDEGVAVERLEDGRVYVTAWRLSGGRDTVYQRIFDPADTKEIRVYTLGGDDIVTVRGESAQSIPVRVVGGPGDDSFTDTSRVPGRLFGFLPIPAGEKTVTYFYDDRGANRIAAAAGTCVDTNRYNPPPGGISQY
jgi:hypothetical protein